MACKAASSFSPSVLISIWEPIPAANNIIDIMLLPSTQLSMPHFRSWILQGKDAQSVASFAAARACKPRLLIMSSVRFGILIVFVFVDIAVTHLHVTKTLGEMFFQRFA